MIVTCITELSKSRSRIEVDYEFAFVLYKGELHIYHVAEGQEIKEEDFNEIMQKVLPKRAKLRCMNLLKTRSYTEKKLGDKLKEGGYPADIIQTAIDYVSSYGYLNDYQYAHDYIEYNKEVKSKLQIYNNLNKRGVPIQITEEIWEDLVGDDRTKLEENQILNWIRKKNFDASNATTAEKQKIITFLYRKGFQIESIRRVLLLDITSI